MYSISNVTQKYDALTILEGLNSKVKIFITVGECITLCYLVTELVGVFHDLGEDSCC
jgi:biotin synthase-related radical SAM superfamily protein